MYLGIDLGTSNSAIVGHEGGVARVFKTVEGNDVLPSAIMLDKRGSLLVGKRAYDQAAFSPENVAQGFKRLMGTSSELSFSSSPVTMTPEAASAEIIKALVSQARMSAGNFEIEGAVITVPAAFNQMQTEATMRAAELAGLDRVALLQEPIAAAMASIATSKAKTSQFLVYDLGGGTFDVAVVRSLSGAATVVGHAGINMLGGRDFDRAILNTFVRPWLLATFDLPDDFHTDPTYQRLLRVAQYRAELTKIALSTQPVDRVFADENQVAAKDRKRDDIYLDVEVSRKGLEALIGVEVDRTIELCRSVINESGYRLEDIDRVVMIGGPSRMPVIRDRVASELGVRVDLESDPMTAVAFGAALYSEGRDWGKASVGSKKSRGSAASRSAHVDLKYDYPARTADEKIRIRIKVGPDTDATGLRLQADTDDGWSSGQVDLSETSELRNVPLVRPGSNRIRLSVFDKTGNRLDDAGAVLEITRASASAEGMPLMHHIAVKIVQGAIGAEANALVRLVEKGTSIPTRGAQRFRAAKDLRAGDGSTLDIELYEQADGVKDPELNLPIGIFQLEASDLERGQLIRRGEDIFVHWEIDANGLLNCKFEVPAISRTYESGKMYAPTASQKNFDGEDAHRMAFGALQSASNEADHVEKALGVSASQEIAAIRRRIDGQREALGLAYDADTRRSVSQEARAIRHDIARLRNNPKHAKEILRTDMDNFIESCSIELTSAIDPRIGTQIQRLVGSARETLNRGGSNSLPDAQQSYEEARALVLLDLAKKPDFWIAMFEGAAERGHLAADKQRHAVLVAAGERAIAAQDLDDLRQVVSDLRNNTISEGDKVRPDLLSGLMQ